MELEEIKRRLKDAFGKYEFVSDGHYYLCDGQRVGIGVTTFLHEYVNPFEKDKIAPLMAKKLDIELDELLAQWKYKADIACEKGTTCHEYAQSLWSLENWKMLPFDGSPEYIAAVNKIKQHAEAFFNDYKHKYTHVFDELVVGSADHDIASAIDHLFYDNEKHGLVIIDYKTNSYLEGYFDNPDKNIYRKKMKPPLTHLEDNAITHYKIQLSIYRYFLELAGIDVVDVKIVYMTEHKDTYEIIDIPYLKKEVSEILEWRKWE